MMSNPDSLILRYRPKTWADVIGHPAVVNSLRTATETRNSHAYLLSGLTGTGKTTLARIIAREHGCAKPFELDAAANNGIDDMRALIENLAYKPMFTDEAKVFIIDECHALSKQAWTSILKSVEEPPEWCFWVFSTTDVGKVPANIMSRCLKAQLKPVNKDDIFDLLAMICDAEKFDTPDEILTICANEAEGSPRQAISNLALCVEAKDRREAAELLRSAAASSESIDLIKALLDGAGWPRLQPILQSLAETDPESIRQQVRTYLTKVLVGTTNEDRVQVVSRLLDQFSEPFFGPNGFTPVVLAVTHFLFTE